MSSRCLVVGLLSLRSRLYRPWPAGRLARFTVATTLVSVQMMAITSARSADVTRGISVLSTPKKAVPKPHPIMATAMRYAGSVCSASATRLNAEPAPHEDVP